MGISSFFKGLFSSKPKSNLPKINVKHRFELLNRTGQGSMSRVWRARDKGSGGIVCLKLLDKVKTANFEARFPGLNKPREGTICLSLRHPNIVRTHEFGITTEGEFYLVMELIEGMGLNFLVETKAQQLEGNRINYLGQIADALDYLHRQGYLHRDICPRNIMVNGEGVVKLIDFGLTVPHRPEFGRPGNRTGTPNYLAPELIRRTTTDHRVDMFALGVSAYEMFCHTLPWEKTESLQTLLSHMNRAGTDPREHRKDLDKATAELLVRAIDRDPNKRFQNPLEFKEALQGLPEHW